MAFGGSRRIVAFGSLMMVADTLFRGNFLLEHIIQINIQHLLLNTYKIYLSTGCDYSF